MMRLAFLARRAPAAARRPRARTHVLLVGSCLVPHPEKPPGEDALFASSRALGVADGVGGSKREGVDPGNFSRRLLAHAAAAEGAAPARAAAAREAASRDALTRAGGSATLLVATLEGDLLEVSNLGDSALALLRPTPRRRRGAVALWPRVVLRTQDQSHYFNCPYQAAANDDLSAAEHLGATDADAVAARCRTGDVVVAATDGFWDNVAEDAAQAIVADRVAVAWAAAARQNAFGPDLSPRVAALTDDPAAADAARDVLDDLASALAAAAVATGRDETAASPFSRAAAAEGLDFAGGKEDDVAVVVALVVDDATALSAVDAAAVDNFGAAGLGGDAG